MYGIGIGYTELRKSCHCLDRVEQIKGKLSYNLVINFLSVNSNYILRSDIPLFNVKCRENTTWRFIKMETVCKIIIKASSIREWIPLDVKNMADSFIKIFYVILFLFVFKLFFLCSSSALKSPSPCTNSRIWRHPHLPPHPNPPIRPPLYLILETFLETHLRSPKFRLRISAHTNRPKSKVLEFCRKIEINLHSKQYCRWGEKTHGIIKVFVFCIEILIS